MRNGNEDYRNGNEDYRNGNEDYSMGMRIIACEKGSDK